MVDKFDIAIIGGGPGGLYAALSAAQSGAQVTLIDSYQTLGGQYYHQPPDRLLNQSTIRQREGQKLINKVIQAGVNIISNTTVWNLDKDKVLACNGPQGSFLIKAEAVILATGTYERSVPFPGWTLPGVIMTGGSQGLLSQNVKPGNRVLLVGTGPIQLVVAKNLLDAGVEVAAVLEGSRFIGRALLHIGAMWGQWQRASEGVSSISTMIGHGVPYQLGWGIVAAHGSKQVESATIARLDKNWRPILGTEKKVVCDTICIGYGFVPFSNLSRILGAEHEWRADLGGEVPIRTETFETSISGIYSVGDGAGIGGVRLSCLEGRIAGFAAPVQLGCDAIYASSQIRKLATALARERRFQKMYANLFTPGDGIYELAKEDTPICRCEDVTLKQLQQAVDEGFTNIAEIKNRTRSGMGECQGRICGHYVTRYVANKAGKQDNQVGSYPVRPPIFPIPIGSLANLESEGEHHL